MDNMKSVGESMNNEKRKRISEEFHSWFKENKKHLINRLVEQEGFGGYYYKLSGMISDYCVEEYCKQNGKNEDEIFENLSFPVMVNNFFDV